MYPDLNFIKYSSDSFIEQMKKLSTLKENGVYTAEEFTFKKADLLSDLKSKGILQNIDDFLSDILILKDENILDLEEIKNIKLFLKGDDKVNEEKTIHIENIPQTSVENKLKSKFFDSSNIIIASFIVIPSLVLLVIFLISDKDSNPAYKYKNQTYETHDYQSNRNSEITNNSTSKETEHLTKKEYWSVTSLERKFVGKSEFELVYSLGQPTSKKQLVSGYNNYAYWYNDVEYDGKYLRNVSFWVVHDQVAEVRFN